jgi:tartrate dehydratase beta subunit/fumarate hydratase class I family protein
MKMQYPVSIRNIRQLKAGDLIEYSGRVMLVNESTIERYRLYEKLEGTPLLNLSREILFFCAPVVGGLNTESFDIDPEDLEYLFMSGVTATVGLDVYEENILNVYRRFSRVNFSVCSRKLLVPVDEQQKVPDEIECGLSVSLKDVLLLVNVSSKGDRFGSDCDA